MPARASRIAGMGAYLPERVVTNHDLAKYLDTSDEWIVQRTGIHERRYTAPGEGSASMGAEAARRAVADAGWSLTDIEFVIFATLSPDHFFPGAGCYMQAMLGMPSVGVLDVRNQCSGFLYALTVADALIVAGQYQRVLVVGSEAHSPCLEDAKAPRDVAVLFGDGAGGVAPAANTGEGRLGAVLHVRVRGGAAHRGKLFYLRGEPLITRTEL